MFYDCSSLKCIILPASVEKIGESAFYSCSRLGDFYIPTDSRLKSIGASAFCKCTQLSDIYLPAGLQSVGHECFRDSGL